MAIIKVKDVAFGRLQAPDLDAEEEFLTHFGMIKVERTKNKLFMRGTGPAHHLHVTELGDSPKLIGFAFYAQSEDDLKKIATAPGASGIENIDEPGGGKRVRLTEPNGYQIEVVAGIPDAKPIHVDRQPINWRESLYERTGDLMRLKKEPSHVMRMGHAVLGSPKVVETVKWFRDTLGLICSDDVYAGDKANVIGSFNRCDNGDDYVDHHVFFCAMNERAGLNHFSFEVEDIDDVFVGHEYLQVAQQVRAYVGHWPPPARQPGLRLLGGPVGPRARALDRLGPAQHPERIEPAAGRGGLLVAVGRAAAREVRPPRQPVTGPDGWPRFGAPSGAPLRWGPLRMLGTSPSMTAYCAVGIVEPVRRMTVRRRAPIKSFGYRVVRYWNKDVLGRTNEVADRVVKGMVRAVRPLSLWERDRARGRSLGTIEP